MSAQMFRVWAPSDGSTCAEAREVRAGNRWQAAEDFAKRGWDGDHFRSLEVHVLDDANHLAIFDVDVEVEPSFTARERE